MPLCKKCGKEITDHSRKVFCSPRCKRAYDHKIFIHRKRSQGEFDGNDAWKKLGE